MQRISLKIGCILCCLFIAGAINAAQAAKSSVRHVSNRIKIVRPEVPSAQTVQEQPSEAARSVQEKSADDRMVKGETGETAAEETARGAEKKTEALATTRSPDEIRKEALGLLGEKEVLYSRKGRLDPFAPFVHGPQPGSAEKIQKRLQRREPRTPLERISLGQLRLTAVMDTPEQRLAMVEEASGKGYVVKKGTYIGDQGGRITKVLADAIVIEEKYLDVFGSVAIREKQLKLQK